MLSLGEEIFLVSKTRCTSGVRPNHRLTSRQITRSTLSREQCKAPSGRDASPCFKDARKARVFEASEIGLDVKYITCAPWQTVMVSGRWNGPVRERQYHFLTATHAHILRFPAFLSNSTSTSNFRINLGHIIQSHNHPIHVDFECVLIN